MLKSEVEPLQPTMLEQLDALAQYASVFSDTAFKCGQWEEPKPRKGVSQLPYFSYDDAIDRFVADAYRFGWVALADWPTWAHSPEGQQLINDPLALSSASIDQLKCVVTTCIRHDKFSEGSLAESFESGLLTRIVQRASELARETRNSLQKT